MCGKHGFVVVRDLTLLYLGWAKAELGLPKEGVSLIRRSIEGLRDHLRSRALGSQYWRKPRPYQARSNPPPPLLRALLP